MAFVDQAVIVYSNSTKTFTPSSSIVAPSSVLDLLSQNTSISAATIFTPTVTGFYVIDVRMAITRSSSSSTLGGSTGVVIAYTDGDATATSISETMALHTSAGIVAVNTTAFTVGTTLEGVKCIYAKAGVAVTVSVGYTSAGTPVSNMQYSLHVRVSSL